MIDWTELPDFAKNEVSLYTSFPEAFLAVRFRTTDARGQQSGGPQYYLQRAIGGAGGRALSVFFACAAVLASFGIGSMTQSNAVAAQLRASFGWDPVIVGIVLAVAVGSVLLGGIEAIGRVTAGFVPKLKHELSKIIDVNTDSLRFYYLGNSVDRKSVV